MYHTKTSILHVREHGSEVKGKDQDHLHWASQEDDGCSRPLDSLSLLLPTTAQQNWHWDTAAACQDCKLLTHLSSP